MLDLFVLPEREREREREMWKTFVQSNCAYITLFVYKQHGKLMCTTCCYQCATYARAWDEITRYSTVSVAQLFTAYSCGFHPE